VPTFADIENKKSQLIRKSLDGSAFIAPNDAEPIDYLTDETGGLLVLPEDWDDVGYLTTDGMPHSRAVTTSDITSFGRTTPTRSDITADTTTITIAAQETKLLTIGLATGADLTGVIPRAGGEVRFRKPRTPAQRTYRLLTMAVDTTEDGEIYIARFFPQAKVTAYADQAFTGGDEALLWGTTFTAQFDDTLGFSESWHFGGSAWEALLLDAGFPAAAATNP
jgi:hypothetical protein